MKLGFKGIEGGSLLDEVEAAVCACFQIPPVVIGAHVGLQNSSDRHNLETSVSLVYANAVKPRWAQIEEALTDDLLAEVDPSPLRFVRFVTSRVEALQEDKQAQADIADKVGGALRVDEVRAMLGYQPLGDERGEELFQKSAPAAPPRPMPDEGEEEAKRARAPHRRKAADDAMRLAIHDATLSAQEAGWTIAAAAELDTDRDGVVSLARGAQKDGPPEPAGAEWVAELIRRAVEFIDTESVPRWRAAVQRLVQATGTASAQRLAAEIGISFDLLQPGLLEYTQREAAWLVTQIADTTKQAIRDALAQGLNEGESIPQMTRRLQESGAFSRSRAELIARTETTRVTNGGQRESLSDYVRENGGKATKRWLTARDERVRPEHVALEGEVRGIDDAFSNGLQAPGEPGCRCTLVYALED